MRTGKERIAISDSGFSIFDGRRHVGHVAWDNIKKVAVFKRDLLTVDAVCLRILTYEPDQYWELDDDVAGFWDLSARLKSALPGYEQNWEEHVVKPAFKENLRFVFDRPLKAD